VKSFKCHLTDAQHKQLLGLVRLVCENNTRLNLVAPGDIPKLWERHVCDSLEALDIVDLCGKNIVDIGSGAGFPGLPIAIAVPSAKITCVERIRKKAAFIRRARLELELQNVEVAWADSAELLQDSRYAGCVDVVTIRAVAHTREALSLASGFLAGNGYALLWQTGDQMLREPLPAGWMDEWFPTETEEGGARGIRKAFRATASSGSGQYNRNTTE